VEPNVERDQDADGRFDAGTARASLSLALPTVEARRGLDRREAVTPG